MIIETKAALQLVNKYFKNFWNMKTKKEELEVDFIGGLDRWQKKKKKE